MKKLVFYRKTKQQQICDTFMHFKCFYAEQMPIIGFASKIIILTKKTFFWF